MDLAFTFLGEIIIVGDHNEGDALLLIEIKQHLFYLGTSNTIEVAGWFVGEDNIWLCDERTSNTDTLFLAATEIFGSILSLIGEINFLQHLHGTLTAGSFVDASYLKWQRYIIKYRVISIHEELLKNEAEAFIAEVIEVTSLEAVNAFLFKIKTTGCWSIKTGEDMHQGRLARTALTDNSEAITFVNSEVYTSESLKCALFFAVYLYQVFDN